MRRRTAKVRVFVFAHRTDILLKGDIEDPLERVFHAPLLPYHLGAHTPWAGREIRIYYSSI
jgi:hypothetical protein